MKYFDFDEFFRSDLADSVGIENYPAQEVEQLVRFHIIALADNVLDPIRNHVGLPLIITSGYRCKALNELVGGKDSSQHLAGYAADFTIRGFTHRDYKSLAFWCADNLDFDQLIVYAKRRFIHVSYLSPESNRHEVLFT